MSKPRILDAVLDLRRALMVANLEPEMLEFTIADPHFRFRDVLQGEIGLPMMSSSPGQPDKLMGFKLNFDE